MELSRLLHDMPKQTLAVIPGPAAGAGLSMALACDMRIAAEDAKLTTAFSKIGASGDYGGSYFLTQLVGSSKARETYFTADVISGAEAARLGIVNKAVPASEAEREAGLARRLAGLPTVALGYIKRNIGVAEHGSLIDVLDTEAIHMVRSMATEDHRAAALAFVEKRPPVFRGPLERTGGAWRPAAVVVGVMDCHASERSSEGRTTGRTDGKCSRILLLHPRRETTTFEAHLRGMRRNCRDRPPTRTAQEQTLHTSDADVALGSRADPHNTRRSIDQIDARTDRRMVVHEKIIGNFAGDPARVHDSSKPCGKSFRPCTSMRETPR